MTDDPPPTDEPTPNETTDEDSPATRPPDGLESEDTPPEPVRNGLSPGDGGADDALPMNRRRWMQTVSAALLGAGAGASAAGSAAAETADTSLSVDERIQQHRTGDLEVVVENPDGSAVSGADVSVAQQSHDFDFGTAVNADRLINQSSPGDNYREYITELFNTAVLGNHHKWRFWENNQQTADDATDWLLDQGLEMRGHVCIWGREDVSAIPEDVLTAIEERDAQTIRDRSMQHIEDIITHYGEDVTEWEVVNEAMHVFQLQLGVYGDQIDQEEPWNGEVVPWTSQLLADWYSQAASVIEENDLDVGIGVNDFNQFAYAYTDGRYETEIEHINDNAVQLDTVGLQAHVGARTGEFNTNSSPDGRISADQVVSEMNTWADHGARVKITEFDTYNGDDWNSDQERADVTENYLRGAFSHPGCDAFVMWGFWDGDHWQDEAPLFYDDWSQKPAYDVWNGLVFGEWWTDDAGTTDSSGTYATSAFLGEHEISVSTSDDSATTTTSVTNSDGTTTVTVTVEGDGGSDDTTAPDTPTNLTATDATSSSITVSWDAVTDNGTSGLDHYNVFVDGSQDQQVPAGTSMATVGSLSADTSYEIGVSAVDGAGNESSTVAVTASTDADGSGDATPPTAPSNLTTTGSTSASVAVDWDASTDSGGSGLDHYNVSLDGTQDQQVAAGTTEATVTGLSPDTIYELGVSAVDGAGNESDAATVSATTEPGDGVGIEPIAELDPSTTEASVGERITFAVTDTTGSDRWIDSLDWAFGDGTTASGWWNAHAYDEAGTYTVALTATANDGQTTTHEVTITVS